MSKPTISRRGALAATAATAASMALGPIGALGAESSEGVVVKNNRLKQSVCRWCFGKFDIETLAINVKAMGLPAIDLLYPDDFAVMKKHGLICSMTMSHSIPKGLNRKEYWDECLGKMRKGIEANAEAGYPNVICFSGNVEGMDRREGMKNCAAALKQILPLAEEKKVTICMELLNSKHDHRDYMCDNSVWGVELVKMVGSERFKLLYDIYHMQIMEGDVIATIRANKDYYGHYHTAGVPGRHELDETQELQYAPIARAIVETGFTDYMAQEFVPTRDPMKSLAEAVKICDV